MQIESTVREDKFCSGIRRLKGVWSLYTQLCVTNIQHDVDWKGVYAVMRDFQLIIVEVCFLSRV